MLTPPIRHITALEQQSRFHCSQPPHPAVASAADRQSELCKPLNKAECDRCFAAYVATCEAVGPAWEVMLAALGRD